MRKKRNFWTKNNCISDAKNYNTRSNWFKNSPSAYGAAQRNKWINECCIHMLELQKPNGYWTLEKCRNEALKYNSKKEWSNKSASSYTKAHRNSWLNNCTKHMIKLGSRFKRLIYAFEFPDKSVYVGLTYDSNRRKLTHLSNSKSQVYKYIQQTGLQPEYKKLTEYLDKDIASQKEGEFVKKYKQEGWTILNKIKSGGLGGDTLIWTKEKCIEDAKQYKTRSEWQKKSRSAWNSARKNNWLDNCCIHMKLLQLPNGYWLNNKKNCLIEAKKYKTKSEFREKNSSAYSAVKKNKWTNEICSHMIVTKPKGYWTLKRCIEVAKLCKTKMEFKSRFSTAYSISTKNKWYECTKHMKKYLGNQYINSWI